MFQLSHSETLSDALITIPLFTEEVLIQKSGHGGSQCFLYSFHPCPGFSCFISLFFVFLLSHLLSQEHKLLESKDFVVILQSRTWQMFRNTG